MRRDLTSALKARDRIAITALRSALAAVDNAGARPVESPSVSGEHGPGAGVTEVDRRPVGDAEVRRIVEAEVTDRSAAAREYERLGRPDLVERLRAEADLLRRYLPGPG